MSDWAAPSPEMARSLSSFTFFRLNRLALWASSP